MESPVIKNFIVSNITFKKPERLSKQLTIIPILYNSNKRLLIQTPKFLIPEIPVIYCHRRLRFYKLKLVAFDYSFNDVTKNYVDKIQSVDRYIKEKASELIKKYKIDNSLENYVPSFYFNKDETKVNFYVNLQMSNNKPQISIFDWKKDKRDLNYIIPQSLSYSILWLQNIWLKDNKVGINWVILQTKVYLPIYKIDECLIIDEEENPYHKKISKIEDNDSINISPIEDNNNYSDGIKLKDHPVYAKFFNMKRFKIPIPAIQMKLKMESLDPNIILKDENEIYDDSTPVHQGGLLSGISNLNLKKIIKNPKKKKNNSGPVISTNGMRPPSLEEILSMKSTLTKTGKKLF